MVRVGSREYWKDANSYPANWEARAAQAARFIRPGWTVLDIGCGPHMALRRHIAAGCTYVPADLYRWTTEVREVDIDAGLFPEGTFDCVVLLGVLEYLARPERVFGFARCRAAAMVVSYCHPLTADPLPREQVGWVNAFSREELGNLAGEHGWLIKASQTFHRSVHTHQLVHGLRQIGTRGLPVSSNSR